MSDRSDGLVIAPAGSAAASRYAPEGDVPASVLRRALAAEPALWRGGERLDFAGGDALPPPIPIAPVVAPFARFLPPLPCRGHDRDGAWAKA
ncbi:MAG: hypothetical protein E5V85_28040 [Mesorhizobium sp.]|nr:MAG: hypothetical protein E5V85_28040 [Mesorhizobium sp.]